MGEVGGSLDPGGVASATTAAALLVQLEARIEALVERHREATRTIEQLKAALADRDASFATLAERGEAAEKLRAELRGRVGRLIEEIGELEKAHADGAAE